MKLWKVNPKELPAQVVIIHLKVRKLLYLKNQD